jgi:hypothetical protein
VITANGDVAEGPQIFPEGTKSGYRTITAFDISEPRLRVYGNVALITIKLDQAVVAGGKPFDKLERQTDTRVWKEAGGTPHDAAGCDFSQAVKVPQETCVCSQK